MQTVAFTMIISDGGSAHNMRDTTTKTLKFFGE